MNLTQTKESLLVFAMSNVCEDDAFFVPESLLCLIK